MAVQLATTTRNARLDAIETEVGASAVLKIFTGAQPANCGSANSGTELVSMDLPADYMAAASSGAKAKSGTWSAAAIAAGVAGHFRIYASDGTTCKMQGSVGEGSGDMSLDNTDIADTQVVTVTSFTLTDGNA
jgi:hypothetical protein